MAQLVKTLKINCLARLLFPPLAFHYGRSDVMCYMIHSDAIARGQFRSWVEQVLADHQVVECSAEGKWEGKLGYRRWTFLPASVVSNGTMLRDDRDARCSIGRTYLVLLRRAE